MKYMANLNSPVVIPKRITSGEELVVLPRKEYEGLLRFYNVRNAPKKKPARKKEPNLSKGLLQALKEVEEGKVSKAYTDVDELIRDLNA